jgi:hypothetical protein
MPETISQQLIYKKAGTFILIPYVNGVPTKANQYIEAGVVDTIQRNASVTTSDMNDGNSTDPAHTYVTKTDRGYDVKLNTYSPKLDALLHGNTYLTGTDADKYIEVVHEHTISSTALDISTTPPATIDTVLQLFVTDRKGNAYTSVTSAAATGQYVFDSTGHKLTFATTDAGTEVLVDVVYDASTDGVVEIQSADNPSLPQFQAVIIGQVENKDEGVIYNTVSTLDKVVATSVTLPNQSNQPGGAWSFALKSQKPRAGHKAHDLKIVPVPTAT